MLEPELVRTDGHMLAKSCKQENCPTGDTHELRQSEATEGNPFNFTPQLIHLHKDHELFEVTSVIIVLVYVS